MKKYSLILALLSTSLWAKEDLILKFNSQRIEALNQRIRLEQTHLTNRKNAEAELADLKDGLLQSRWDAATLRERRQELATELAEIKVTRQQYETERRQAARAKVLGEKFESIEIPGARTYHDIVVRKVTDVGLEVSHRTGRARLSFEKLSLAMQQRLHYDKEQAELALAAEREVEFQRNQLAFVRARIQEEAKVKKNLRSIRSRAASAALITSRRTSRSSVAKKKPVSTWRERRAARQARRLRRSGGGG